MGIVEEANKMCVLKKKPYLLNKKYFAIKQISYI